MAISVGLTLAPWRDQALQYTLDIVAGSGYQGAMARLSHLTPWQDDLGQFRDLWEQRDLRLAACVVTGQWDERTEVRDGLERFRREVELLADLECRHVLLSLPVRRELLLVAGYEHLRQLFVLSPDRLCYLGENLNMLAEVILDFGLRPSVGNRLGTGIETADEVAQLMEATEPELVSLALDIGHARVAGALPEALAQDYTARIALLICKDVDQDILRSTREERYDYDTFLKRGGYVPLGKGHLPLTRIMAPLRRSLTDDDGWLIVDPERPAIRPEDSAELSREFLLDELEL